MIRRGFVAILLAGCAGALRLLPEDQLCDFSEEVHVCGISPARGVPRRAGFDDHASERGAYGSVGTDSHGPESPPWTLESVTALTGVSSISFGRDHGCALRDGAVLCWGHNWLGQLGDGTLTDRPEPRVVELPPIRAVDAGELRSCAVDEHDRIWCWGLDRARGWHGPVVARVRPAPLAEAPGVRDVVAGGGHFCAQTGDRAVCVGETAEGLLTSDEERVPSIVTLPADVVVAGTTHTCALRRGVVHCRGALGGDYPNPYAWGTVACILCADFVRDPVYRFHGLELPIAMQRDVVELATSSFRVCTRHSDGAVRCVAGRYAPAWCGATSAGELEEIAALRGGTHLGVAESFVCAVAGDLLRCVDREQVLQEMVLDAPVAELSVGGARGCVRFTHGQVACFHDGHADRVETNGPW